MRVQVYHIARHPMRGHVQLVLCVFVFAFFFMFRKRALLATHAVTAITVDYRGAARAGGQRFSICQKSIAAASAYSVSDYSNPNAFNIVHTPSVW